MKIAESQNGFLKVEIPMNIEGISRDESVFAEGSLYDSRRG